MIPHPPPRLRLRLLAPAWSVGVVACALLGVVWVIGCGLAALL